MLVSEDCFGTGGETLVSTGETLVFTDETLVFTGEISVFTGEIGAFFSCEIDSAFVLFGDGDLSLSDLFDIFVTFGFALVVAGLISSDLPSGLVRIISKRSPSDICLMPKLLA